MSENEGVSRYLRKFAGPILQVVYQLRQSYWFVPGALAIGAVILAASVTWLDRLLTPEGDPLNLPGVTIQAEGARQLMGIISQSIFGVTGVMFSMTLVAVSFASGKFGPRLIGNFMGDRVNQWSLGILISTFVFSLLVTRAIHDGSGLPHPFVPQLSIMLALFLTMVCIGIVIYFVHHIPEMIDISNITASLGEGLVQALKDLAEAQAKAHGDGFVPPDDLPDADIAATTAGYLQAVYTDTLHDIAERDGLGIEVTVPSGAFVTSQAPLLRIWGGAPSEETEEEILGCFAFGNGPTANQNVLFLLDQLVEITARALSPGINDPFTAISCVNWMHAGTVIAANHADGLTGRRDGPVYQPPVTFEHVLQAGLGASRPYTKTDPLCDRHVEKVLDQIEAEIRPGPHLRTFLDFRQGLASTAEQPEEGRRSA